MDNKDHSVPDKHHVARTGHWMSQDKRHHYEFMQSVIDEVDTNPQSLAPCLQEFKDVVTKDVRLYMLFNVMFAEIPKGKKYLSDPTGEVPSVRDFEHLLAILNYIIAHAPSWRDAGNKVGLVGVPFNAVLDWPMGTQAGFAVFQDPKVNEQVKKVLDVWGKYLASPESAEVLADDETGWFGPTGKKSLEDVANLYGKTNAKFEDMFHCDPKAKYHGYKSWDDFFTRQVKDSFRPVASPDDDDIIANSCESRTYKVAKDVKARDQFWAKGQPYSVLDMLAHDELADAFVGGTVYQAFLSALSYHRWHTAVSGTIKKAYVVPGTYFSEPITTDPDDNDGLSSMSENTAQEYLSVMATRALVFIEADNPKIGLMAFIGIGMTEVSTCDITVKVGQHVKKGDQLGMFHFGGSTHCNLFRKGVKLEDFPEPGISHNVPVRSKLARVV